MATKRHKNHKTEPECGQQQNGWEQDTPELKEFLLEAVEGNHTPFRSGELKEMGERIIAEREK